MTQEEFDALIIGGHDNISVDSGEITVTSDSVVVRASGSAVVTSWGSATVHAAGSAMVRSNGSAQVVAIDTAKVVADNSTTVTASDNVEVIAYGITRVRAYGKAKVRAFGTTEVRASSSVQVWAYEETTVIAHEATTVWAYDTAMVRAYKGATVIASDLSAVFKRGDDDVTIKTNGRATCILPPTTLAEWIAAYAPEVLPDGRIVGFRTVGVDCELNGAIRWSPNSFVDAKAFGGPIPFCVTAAKAVRMCGEGSIVRAAIGGVNSNRLADITIHPNLNYWGVFLAGWCIVLSKEPMGNDQ